MTPADHQHSPDQHFATDLEVADAEAAPARSADSLVVHGMLSMIAPDEPARLEARIERAIAAVHAESGSASTLARIGPSSHGAGAPHSLRGRYASWQRRMALAGGGIGIAAVLGFAVLFTPSGQSPSGSQAYAALDSIRAATARTEDRTFRVRVEHTGPREPGRAGLPKREGIREALRDGVREGARDGMREGPREGELVLGSGGRYTLSWRAVGSDRGPGRGITITTGFDGSQYWAVLPDGTVRTAAHPAEIKLPPLYGTEPARQGEDEDAEQLTLDSMLARLERGYEITFADRAPGVADSGAPLIEVTATRRAGAGRRDRDRPLPPPTARDGERDGRGRGGDDRPPPDRPGGGFGPDGPRGPGHGGSAGPGPGGPGHGGPAGPGPGGPGHGGGPDLVRVLADASTFDVERLEARWTSGMTRTLVIERVTNAGMPAARPAEWFTPSAHTRRAPR